MIPSSTVFDQHTLELLMEHDPVAQEYREWFSHLDFHPFQGRRPTPKDSKRGNPGHPETAYVKAFLIKIKNKHVYMTELRHYLVQHPFLVLELGFQPELDPTQPFGFNVDKTVPTASWLRTKLKSMDQDQLHTLFAQTVHALQEEIPGLGETIAVDVKHIYAWVKANNPRVSMSWRFLPANQPTGDPDCRVGVKKSTNQEQADGSSKEKKEYLWGYGTGIVSAITADYGDVVLAEYT